MSHKAAREALEKSLCHYSPQYHEMKIPYVAEVEAILQALAPHLLPDGCVAVCSKCRLEHCGSLIGCGLKDCPMRQGDKP